MRQLSLSLRVTLVACALGATAVSALAQTAHDDSAVSKPVAKKQKSEIAKGDPARWYRADNSPQARLSTQKKEINAAYAEAKTACRKEAAAARSKCMKDAQLAYRHDMAQAPMLVAHGSNPEVLKQVSPIDTSGGPGESQVGGSGTTSSTEAGNADSAAKQSAMAELNRVGPPEYRPLSKDNAQSGSSESGATQSGATEAGTTGKDAGNMDNGTEATRPPAPPPEQQPAGKPIEPH
jgi:hypothetical protein